MSEQENLPAVIEQTKTVTATHRASLNIGNDGRHVIVHRFEDGGYSFEWSKPDPNNGEAMISTKVSITMEALEATLGCLFAIDGHIRDANAAAYEQAKQAEQEAEA